MDNRYKEMVEAYQMRDQLARKAVDETDKRRQQEAHERNARRKRAHEEDVTNEQNSRARATDSERIVEREYVESKNDGKMGQERNETPSPTASTPTRYNDLVKKYGGGEKDAADRLDPDSIGRAPTYKHISNTLRDEDDAPERTLYTD